MNDFDNETFEMDNDLPAEGIEILDDDISFGTTDADTVLMSDTDTVMDVAAPIAVGTVAPLAAAIVRETERVEVVEESVPAPVSVISEPEPVYTAPIVEPVHHVRWPWALLALPLLAIPFIHRTAQTPVAEPVVVQTPVVRELVVAEPEVKATVAPKAKVAAPKVVETPKKEIPVCDGDFIAKDAAVLRETASDTGKSVQTVAANTVVAVTEAEDAGYYKVTVGTDKGYLPVSMVVCQVAQARTTVTG